MFPMPQNTFLPILPTDASKCGNAAGILILDTGAMWKFNQNKVKQSEEEV